MLELHKAFATSDVVESSLTTATEAFSYPPSCSPTDVGARNGRDSCFTDPRLTEQHCGRI